MAHSQDTDSTAPRRTYPVYGVVRVDRATGTAVETITAGLTHDEARIVRNTHATAPGVDEDVTGFRVVTMPLIEQAAILAPETYTAPAVDAEARDLATLCALRDLWASHTNRIAWDWNVPIDASDPKTPDVLAYLEMTAAALGVLTEDYHREDDDSEAQKRALVEAFGRAIRAGLVWDQFVPSRPSAMLDALQDALWTRAKAQRTDADVPAGMLRVDRPALSADRTSASTSAPAARVRAAR